MDENDPLVERLRGLAGHGIDPSVASGHLDAIARVPTRTYRFAKLKVGVAFFAGLMLGGTGLAYAGALPAPVQDAAHGALSQVGLSVPRGHGPARYNGPECTGGPYANHGQYVRSHKSDPNAGSSRCGKPVQAGTGAGSDGTEAPEAPDNNQGDTRGGGHGHGHQGDKGSPGATPLTPSAPSTSPATTVPTPTTSPSTTTTTTTAPTSPTSPTSSTSLG